LVTAPDAETRFAFGENWRRFLSELDEERIERAEASLPEMLGTGSLKGKTFLDVGSGSGLFSLAARRLGALVRSFDYDPDSVACGLALKSRFYADDAGWSIERGSALDAAYMASLGTYDFVYSWGVLHHTGDMWKGVELTARAVAPGGRLFIALYNDQGWRSGAWRAVKWLYNVLPGPARWLVLGPAFVRAWGPTFLKDAAKGSPLATWRAYASPRGMSPWRDVVDWVGGYPFETASPEQVLGFVQPLGFRVVKTRLNTGYGCSEFVFERA
jgi:2-polyprenyl-6-hydroxyphenyl methylase/3-demethylubiquinone-9 3-methyltransferase